MLRHRRSRSRLIRRASSKANSGTTPFTFTVTRSGSTAGTSSASYAVSGGTANAADFGGTLPSGTVSFAAGETSKTVTLNVSGDTTVEPDESFNVVLSSPAGATIGTGTASSTILNDDVAAPALSITADQTSKLEGNSGTTPFTFTVTRSGSTAGTSSASYAVSGGTANAADFGGTLPSGTVSFAVGETSKTVTLNVSGDTTVEPDESFNVVLSSPAGATIGTGTASSTILNDDVAAPALSITADQTSKLEGNSGTTPFTFTVTRSGSTAGTSSASYAVSGGTANAADFGGTLPSGTVSFAAGETSKTVTLNVSGDTTVEPDETFDVVLSSPAGATIGTGTASSTILNDDVAAPALSITADQTGKLEGNSGTTPFTFTVTRSGSTAGTSSASYAVSGGTANAADFGGTLPSGTVSFAAGETSKTVTLNVSGDTTVEPDESFNVVLSSPAGATIGTGTASSTILNDDVAAPALSITADQTSKLEGNSGTTPFTFTVTRSGSTAGTSSASYAVSGGTANAADFGGTLPSGTVSFAAGETSKTVTLNVSGDTTVEPDESFNVVLSSPAGATIGTGTASSTILNDDVAATALYGTEGNDVLTGTITGRNVIYGLGGNDTISVTYINATTELYGGDGDDKITGSLWGADYIDGGPGNDILSGNWGNDIILGGDGNDRINGGAGDDVLYTGSGNDYVQGDYGNDTIYCGPGTNQIDGGPGTDTAVFAGNYAGYGLSFASGVTKVVGIEGTSSLTNIEIIKFDDGSYNVLTGLFQA